MRELAREGGQRSSSSSVLGFALRVVVRTCKHLKDINKVATYVVHQHEPNQGTRMMNRWSCLQTRERAPRQSRAILMRFGYIYYTIVRPTRARICQKFSEALPLGGPGRGFGNSFQPAIDASRETLTNCVIAPSAKMRLACDPAGF